MRRILTSLACTALLVPGLAFAEPIQLKLSFFSSDRTVAYQTAIQPFVDAINSVPRQLVEIKVYFSGALGKVQRELPQQVLDGTADIAFIIPGQNPERFVDNPVMELPGLFRSAREATLTYTRLIAANALAGYDDFFVIGAFATEPEVINSRKPLRNLAELKGQKIRTNNTTQAAALAKLGVVPVVLAFNETTMQISSGALDGATVPIAQLFDVGIGRFTSNHYLLRTSVAPLTLMMNRKVFERLPAEAQELIRKYSGEWAAARFIEAYDVANRKAIDEIRTNQRRQIVVPSPADERTAQAAFGAERQQWAAANPHNRQLLDLAQSILVKVRQSSAATDSGGGAKEQ